MTFPQFRALSAFLAETGFRNPTSSKQAPFQKAFGTDMTYMDYLMAHPDIAADMFEYMAVFKATARAWMDGSIPVDDFKISVEDIQNGRTMMVDV